MRQWPAHAAPKAHPNLGAVSRTMNLSPGLLAGKLRESSMRAFQYPDFRKLWFGAFFSFIGSWVQMVAQGWLVYDITGDRAKLAMVSFLSMLPMAVLGPFAGTLTDTQNRRALLIWCQVIYACNALFLAAAVHWNFVAYEQILIVALINGFVNCAETPTRQSLVGTIVPPEGLSAAVPINAMTFNLARVIGPAVGGLLLRLIGAEACYVLNGISFIALISAVATIRADISATATRSEPLMDLVREGMAYTWRDLRLRTLFFMEAATSMFGLIYLPMMPAVAKDMLRLDETGLGFAMTSVGIGGMLGLVTLMLLSERPIKAKLARYAMTVFAVALMALSVIRVPWIAFICLGITGMTAIMQFNATNTLFQLLSPEALRGRVLAMHVWALSGSAPLTLPLFGWIAQAAGVHIAIRIGATLVGIGAALAWVHRSRLADAP
jgi:MFS family permease